MSEQTVLERIEQVLEQIRPNIQMDGGDIELVKFEDGIVYVRLLGACIGCPASMYTLKLGVEERIREEISEVSEVVLVEDE